MKKRTPPRRRQVPVKPLTPELREAAYAAMRRTFAANLRRIREARGLKRYGAALELGVSASTWSRWEAGQRFPTPPLLAGIAALLEAPVAEFFSPVLVDSD
ncbi:MAG: helix-turn-helix transcriptional regulator [Kiritimatiellae bacterium]|nr:helix-turn-helix transcriptional regulator [Kiritimatiellia bacterium]